MSWLLAPWIQDVMFGTLSLTTFRLGEKFTGVLKGSRIMAFVVLALSRIVQAFNMRSGHSLFRTGPFANHKLNIVALAAVLVMPAVFTHLRGAFGLTEHHKRHHSAAAWFRAAAVVLFFLCFCRQQFTKDSPNRLK